MTRFQLLALTAMAALFPCAEQAWARGYIGVGINLGPPVYYGRPWYPYYGYGYPYVRPTVIYDGSPVYVAPSTVVVQQPTPGAAAPPITTVTPGSPTILAPSSQSLDDTLKLLASAEDAVRGDAAMALGRMKADRAIDPLAATLAGDRSPAVRDAAARALGLIGSPRSLTALIHAAQADADRDVRHSAQFAVEIIRNSLPRN